MKENNGNISIISFTDRGDRLNIRLSEALRKTGYEPETALRGKGGDSRDLFSWTRSAFKGDALIFIGAAGIAVRAIAPFIEAKDKDPAVIVIDEAGEKVIPILSGHLGGANALSRRIAQIIEAEAVITTSTDINGVWAVDLWASDRGYHIEDPGMIKHVSAALLRGETVGLISDLHGSMEEVFNDKGSDGKPADGQSAGIEVPGMESPGIQFPENVVFGKKECETGIVISPYLRKEYPYTLNLIPTCLSLGIGCRRGAGYPELDSFLKDLFKENNLSFSALSDISTINIKRDEEAFAALSREYEIPLSFYSAEELSVLPGDFSFERSEFVKEKTGCDNVCERSAVKKALEYADGEDVKVIIKKVKGEGITAAVSMYRAKQGNRGLRDWDPGISGAASELIYAEQDSGRKQGGMIYVVGLGPGNPEAMTEKAREAIERSGFITGYRVYLELIRDLISGKETAESGMGDERERCILAREAALNGKTAAIVCSGDAGIYGMAGPVLEVCRDYPGINIEIVPGITAAVSGGALLGAPLMNDFSVLSLSDIHVPRDVIQKRIEAAARGDMVMVIYNPMSRIRRDNLRTACDIILKERPGDTVCGYVRNIGRDGEEAVICTLKELRELNLDMFTTVFVGNSMTRLINGKMVTARYFEGEGVRES